MKKLSLLLVLAVLTGCASTNTGNPALDAQHRYQNKVTQQLIGRGVVRFLSEVPRQVSLEEILFPMPPIEVDGK